MVEPPLTTDHCPLITEFTSPFNVDEGEKHYNVGEAASMMRLATSNDDRRGVIYWEWEVTTGPYRGERGLVRIGLLFDDRRSLTAFEGVYDLPQEAIKLLEDNGFDASYAKV